MARKASNGYRLLISLIICQLPGLIGSVSTIRAIPTWYATLTKPSFTPPNGVFGPVWVTLYLMMGVSLFLVWRRGFSDSQARLAGVWFGVQLLLNALWSPAFFGLRSPLVGLVVIVGLWLAILFTIASFFRVSRTAGFLLIPYFLWVSFAAVLNASIYVLNR